MLGKPLAGVRVLACEQAVAGPFCSFVMAELGADVIKVERPTSGDVIRGWDDVVSGLSSGYVWLSGGKRDIAVNIQTTEGRDVIRSLVATADVFLENFAPGVMARLGLGYDQLSAANPGLVYCSLSGYGTNGPYRDAKAFDLLIQGESGILLMNGSPEEPAKVALPIVDLVAGSTALIGVLGALRTRDATGQGTFVDVSMLDSIALWLGYFPHYSWNGREQPARSGMRHHRIVPYGPYRASDGRYINLVAGSDEHWRILCHEVLDRPEWADDADYATVASRAENSVALNDQLDTLLAGHDADHWLARLERTTLPYGEVRTVESAAKHPQLLARNMVVTADTPVGRVPMFRFALADPDPVRHVPTLGEDTESVLAQAGYAADHIAELRAAGIIR